MVPIISRGIASAKLFVTDLFKINEPVIFSSGSCKMVLLTNVLTKMPIYLTALWKLRGKYFGKYLGTFYSNIWSHWCPKMSCIFHSTWLKGFPLPCLLNICFEWTIPELLLIYFVLFLKMGHPRLIFHLFLALSKQTIQILLEIKVKNVHPV